MNSVISEIVAERIGFAGQFMKERGIAYDEIENAFKCDVHDSKHLLLTSSAVHGLANSGSDIDFISVNQKTFPPDRVAAQQFSNGKHMEVKPIWEEDVKAALAFLESLKSKSFSEVMDFWKHWDDHCKISKKYLERTVNGVDINGSCPYMGYTPSLAYVWQTSSFETFRRCVIYCILSERSGERMARISYGMNALLYVMDSMLSLHGNVYSNKKWYLQRYTRFVKAEKFMPKFLDLVTKINNLYNLVISSPANNILISPLLYDLYIQAKELMNVSILEDSLFDSEASLRALPFLENAIMIYDDADRKAVLIQSSEMADWDLSLDSILMLEQSSAYQLLTMLRTGLLKIKLGDGRNAITNENESNATVQL